MKNNKSSITKIYQIITINRDISHTTVACPRSQLIGTGYSSLYNGDVQCHRHHNKISLNPMDMSASGAFPGPISYGLP